jgi:hypothetical protein
MSRMLVVGRLATVAKELVAIQKKFSLRFDLYRVNKPDHAVICFTTKFLAASPHGQFSVGGNKQRCGISW